jgi:hypothetical protein
MFMFCCYNFLFLQKYIFEKRKRERERKKREPQRTQIHTLENQRKIEKENKHIIIMI